MNALFTFGADQLPHEAEIRNDLITDVRIRCDRGFILGLTVEFKSCRQPLFNGYHNTGNIGKIILALAELLGVGGLDSCGDVLGAFRGVPCRVASCDKWGDVIAENAWIGHFMEDRFALAKDVVQVGVAGKGDGET